MTKSKYITGKEIADILEVSRSAVFKMETRLGLKPFRINTGGRSVRYQRAGVEKTLKERGYTIL